VSRAVKLLKGHPLFVVVAVGLVLYALFGDKLPHVDTEQVLKDLSDSLGKWTYLLVGVLAFLETGAFVGLVFPGETAVLIAGAVAGQGDTSIVLTIAIVWFSAWLGDTASFFIGRKLGREFIVRHGPRVRITEERFAQVEGYFARHGGKTILIGRFIGLVRALAPFIAGSSGMRYRAFVPYSVLGTGLWATAFSLLGYFLSSNIGKATSIAGKGAFYFAVTVAIVVALFVVLRTLRDPVRRSRLARTLEGNRLGRPMVALGRRIEPQARFVWHRLTPGGLGLELTSILAVLAVSSFVFFGYAIVLDGHPGPTGADTAAFDAATDIRTGWLTDVAKVVTTLGSSFVTVPLAIFAAILLWRSGHRLEMAVLVAGVAISHAGVGLTKELLDRPRPEGRLIEVSGSSYPSGHATYAVVYPALALIATLRWRPQLTRGMGLIIAGVVVALGIALSRVYLHVHYLSDISGGAGLGVSAFALSAAVALVVSHLRDDPAQA
jgi:membrane protein DedA with SNARE-associated domain